MAVKSLFSSLSAKSGGNSSAASLRMRVLDEFDHAGIGWIWATDGQGKLIYLADRAIERLGLEADTLIGQPIEDIFEIDENNQSDGSSRPLKFQIKAMNKIRDQVVRFKLGTAAGDIRQTWWSLSGHPVRDDKGEFIGYRGNASDVTIE